jgi:hypothetical protein
MWKVVMAQLRKFLKGYGANLRVEQRKKRESLVEEIDKLAKADKLDRKGWAERMELEGELVAVYK